jgi:hypothetical protein
MSLWKVLTARWGSGAGETDQIRIDASTNSLQVVDYAHHEVHSGSAYYTEGHVTLEDGPGNFYANFITPDTPKLGHFTWHISSSGITDIKFYEGANGGMGNGLRGTIHAHNRSKSCWMGWQDGGDGQALLTDSSQSWTPDALSGMQVFNQTDGSSAFITDNNGTTVTATLAGGIQNDWDDNEVFEINNSQIIVNVGIEVPTVYGLLIGDQAFGGTGFKGDIGGAITRQQEIVTRRNETYLMHIASSSADNIITFRLDWYEHTDKH